MPREPLKLHGSVIHTIGQCHFKSRGFYSQGATGKKNGKNFIPDELQGLGQLLQAWTVKGRQYFCVWTQRQIGWLCWIKSHVFFWNGIWISMFHRRNCVKKRLHNWPLTGGCACLHPLVRGYWNKMFRPIPVEAIKTRWAHPFMQSLSKHKTVEGRFEKHEWARYDGARL